MKGKKRIGILALSLAFVGVASSCGGYAISRNTTPAKEEAAVVIEDTDRTELRNIVLDTSNARTVFYIGEEFNYDGLVVNRSLAVYDKNNTSKGLVNMPTKDFTVDSSEVDMTTSGTYKVTVTHRLSNRILTQTYNVDVKPSVFESTPGLTFNAGLEVYFEDGKRVKEYLLHDEFVEKYKNQYDHDFNLYQLLNGLSIKLHKWSSDGKTAKESKLVSLTPDQVTIESSTVDIDEIGTYVVKVTYKANDIVIDGVSYNNNAEAFLIINVSDPILSMWIEGGKSNFGQALGGIDFSESGWEIHYETIVEGEHEEPFSYDKYDVTSPDILNTTDTQTLIVTMKDEPTITCKKNVKIVKSETQDIVSYYNLSPEIKEYSGDVPSVIAIADTNYIYGPVPKLIDTTEYGKTGATYTARVDNYNGIDFRERISIKGTSQAFKFVMDKPGDIVVYFAPTGSEEADLSLYGSTSTGEINVGNKLETHTSTDIKQEFSTAIFNIPTAGTYYLCAPNAGAYVHGFIVGKNK